MTLELLQEAFVGGDLRLTSMLFVGVVGFVLLICCANVANLLLARATARERELTIRAAVGAGRGRIVRHLLTESLVLASIGGALAIGVGAALLRAAPTLLPEGLLPAAVTLTFDGRVVAFCLAASVVVGVAFGLFPSWQATGTSRVETMTAGGRASAGRGSRARALLVVAEVAVAVLLLFGAGLLLRTLLTLDAADRGYRGEGVVTMLVDPLGSEYPTPAHLLRFYDAVERELLGDPHARSVAWTSTLPLGGSMLGSTSFEIVGDVVPHSRAAPERQHPGRQSRVLPHRRRSNRQRSPVHGP